MIVPTDAVSPEALLGVIEDWLSRQSQEAVPSAEEKSQWIEQVRQALKGGDLVLTWNHDSQTINIVPKEEAAEFLASGNNDQE